MILCLSSHTDDVELGAGGYLAATDEPKIGFCFTAHSAFKHLLPEMLDSWSILDIKYLKHHDQNFTHRNFDRQQVLDALIKLRQEYNPRVVLTHSSFDQHQDPQVVYQETLRAFKHCTILGYNLEWNNTLGHDFRYFKSLRYGHVFKKISALKCYKSQIDRSYFDHEYQMAQMILNGQLCNSMYAEKFQILRWIE